MITFIALATIYRTVPNASVPFHGVWPGALGATMAIAVVDYGFPFYLSNVSVFGGLRVDPRVRADRADLVLRRSRSSSSAARWSTS